MLPGSFRHAPWEMKKATVQVHHGLCVYTSPVRWMPARVQRRRTHFGLQCPCAQKRTLCIAQTSRRFVLLFYTSPFFARNQCLLRTFGKRHKKPPVPAGFFGVFIKGFPPVQPCVRSANFAPHSPTGFRLIYEHLSRAAAPGTPAPWAMVGFLLGNTVSENGSVSRGVCELDERSRLVRVTERTRIEKRDGGIAYTEDGGESWVPLPETAVVSMNLWGFTPDFVARAQAGFAAFLTENLPRNPLKCEYYLPSVVTAALADGAAEVTVLTSPDKWHGITYREDKPELVAALARMAQEGLYPKDRLF